MKKLIVTAVATIALMGAVPSVASAGEWEVPPGAVGIFNHGGFQWLLGYRYPRFGPENVSHDSNDKMSSWVNKSSTRSSWWEHANRNGFCRPMVPGYYAATIYRDENDKLTSWASNRWGVGC